MPAATQANAIYLTTSAVARGLGCTPATLLKWAAADPRFPQPSRLSERSVARLRRRDDSCPAGTRLPGVRRALFDRATILDCLRNLTCTPLGEALP